MDVRSFQAWISVSFSNRERVTVPPDPIVERLITYGIEMILQSSLAGASCLLSDI